MVNMMKSWLLNVLLSTLLHDAIELFAFRVGHFFLGFSYERFTTAFEAAQLLALLKKLGIDKGALSNYNPSSNI
jgi:hypothetical protein